jgi:hypothetical protein
LPQPDLEISRPFNRSINGIGFSEGKRTVACKSCRSNQRKKFTAEVAIHFPGPENLDQPAIFLFPKLSICLQCGKAEFAVPESELRLLGKGRPRRADLTAGFRRNRFRSSKQDLA